MPFLRIVFPSIGVRSDRAAPCMDGRWGGGPDKPMACSLRPCNVNPAPMLKPLHPQQVRMGEPFKNLAWDDFRLVKAIADAKGLPAAAERLGVNHSTVFRRLRQIEAALGVPLFERHRLGYVATSAGEEMVALADRLDEDITAFTRKVSGRELSPAGELRVTTNDSLLIHLLTPLFVKFRKQCHDVRLDVVLANQELNLSKRDADVAIRATDKPPENLVGRRAATIAWALYGRAEEFPDPALVEPESLYQRDWVSLGDNLVAL